MSLADHQTGLKKEATANREVANKLSWQLSSQLVLVATVLITFSAPTLANEQLIHSISLPTKLLLLGAWTLLIISILFGLVGLAFDRNVFRAAANSYSDLAGRIGKGVITTEAGFTTELADVNSRTRVSSPEWPLMLQSILFTVGLIAFVIATAFILF